LSARFGYCIESYFAYILFGSIRQKEKLDITARQADNGNPAGSYHFRKNKYTSRFSYGLGVQKTITEMLDLGLEYKTSRLPKKDYTFYLSDADRTYVRTSFKYRLHTIAVRLIYKF
jgi:opacity protein-like surface antigen